MTWAKVAALLGVALCSTLGCHHRLPKLLQRGEIDEVIERAESSRWPPRRAAARAYAEALVIRGQVEKAQAVLQRDYRRGGQVKSLVALADLERTLGLDGVAAAHYARAADLDQKPLVGRADVCALMRARARRLLALGEALAAEQDLDLAVRLCGAPEARAARMQHQALARAIDAAADEQVDRRVARSRCPGGGTVAEGGCDEPTEAERIAAVEAALQRAADEGPAALRVAAARYDAQLRPEQIVELLLAEARGDLASALLPDDEVRRWVGDQRWHELAPVALTDDAAVSAWVQLRLAAVMGDMPVTPAPPRGPSQRDRWADRSLELAGAQKWRILGWMGDLSGAELAIASTYRPGAPEPGAPGSGAGDPTKPAASTSTSPAAAEPDGADAKKPAAPATTSPAPGESDTADAKKPAAPASASPTEADTKAPTRKQTPRSVTVEPPRHWVTRVEPTAASVPATLVLARLREHQGQDDRALEIARYVLARAAEVGVKDVSRWTVREVARQLARGRPWHALAIADAVPRVAVEPARAAAATAIELTRAFCGGVCRDDEERAAVQRVMGEAWMAEMTARVPALARADLDTHLGRTSGASPSSRACPTLGEYLGPDAGGPVARALAVAREDPTQASLGDALRVALASDLTLSCASTYVLPLMMAADTRTGAAVLAEKLAHAPQMLAASQLLTHTKLALVARQSMRAEILAVATGAASSDPARTWLEIAAFAHLGEDREVELMALRETILHTPDLEHEPARRALVVEALRDLGRNWAVRNTEVGREAVHRHVAEYLAASAPAQRWARREMLARTVGPAAWADPIRPALEDALLPGDTAGVHPVAAAWIAGDDTVEGHATSFELEATALRYARGKAAALPPEVVVFADPAAYEDARLRIAESARDWTLRWRTAIGLAAYGRAPARAAAIVQLRGMIEKPQGRAALDELLLDRLGVLEPVAPIEAEHQPAPAVLVDDGDALLRVVYGLDPSIAWFGRTGDRPAARPKPPGNKGAKASR